MKFAGYKPDGGETFICFLDAKRILIKLSLWQSLTLMTNFVKKQTCEISDYSSLSYVHEINLTEVKQLGDFSCAKYPPNELKEISGLS